MGLIQNQMNGDGPVPKGPAELNRIQHMQDEDGQKARGGVTGEGQELSVEDESRINDGTEGEMYGHHVNGRAQVLNLTVEDQIQVVELDRTNTTGSHEKTQAPLVRWERFLPVRSLKVLLVENDDSTRHVVSALLRNCGYEG
ncbi:hypothetical protein L6164_005586 [Bauhinia variegata]|uniref:Uncharacterized protein n=1 Tax=Bauhinia variegata TaxID=167791 RepID=A0ACB9PR31_BAUVA|nr:hypothetical protein L6164_005586 [Bauhinia variegata]